MQLLEVRTLHFIPVLFSSSTFTLIVLGYSIGLRVALIEQDDFSAGTSSRSTKLLHGGGKEQFYFYIFFYGAVLANFILFYFLS